MRVRLAAAIVACLLVVAVAQAHDTWIVATPSGAGSNATLRVDMTSGMAFPTLESGIRPERVTRAMLRVGGESRALPAPLATRVSLRYSLPLTPPGIAVVWVQLAPRALDLKPELIEEYLHEIGALQTAGARWRARAEPKRWHEVYRKHTKTYARFGASAAGDESWRDPVGMELELAPESDPTALAAGQAFSLVLLKNGQPLAGLPVAAERGSKADRKRSLATSDAAGRVRFELDRAGPWLFAATELRENGADWESDFTTLTVVVAPGAR